MDTDRRLSSTQIDALARDVLERHGFSAAQAGAIAETITRAEQDGCLSHGLFRLPFYVAALRNSHADPTVEPSVSSDDNSAVVHVEAHGGFCPRALQLGLPALVNKAHQHGLAALAIHDTFNIAALWPEVETLAEQGLVAFAFTAANAYVAPAGGHKPVYGTNPMAFGFPRQDAPPLVFDQASSASARGEILLHQREGKPLPEGWAVDRHGQPTTDPAAALEGAQLAFGGHKGASLALMVELLAGALIGDLFSFESTAQDTADTHAPLGGEFLLAIDPMYCNPRGNHLARAETLFAEVLAQPGTRLPSQRRHAQRAAHREQGVMVSGRLLDQLASL